MTTTVLPVDRSRTIDVSALRWELFTFPDVREVHPGARPGTLRIVHRGPARPQEWRAALASAGLVGEREQPTPAA